jgi:hypothetical protein
VESHFKWECPEGRKKDKIVPLRTFEEEWGLRGSFMWTGPTKSPW